MTSIATVDAQRIEREIAALEARAGIQVVAAVVPRSDSYPELPWRAFALGASVAALCALLVDLGYSERLTAQALLLQALAILGGGAVAAASVHVFPPVARGFLAAARATGEVRQCAEGMFVARELFLAPGRDAVLILVSLFEHRVVIVPDIFYRGRVATADWEGVVGCMTPLLRQGRTTEAFIAGLGALDALLAAKGVSSGRRANALPDTLVRGIAP